MIPEQLQTVRMWIAHCDCETCRVVRDLVDHIDIQAELFRGLAIENEKATQDLIWANEQVENLREEAKRLREDISSRDENERLIRKDAVEIIDALRTENARLRQLAEYER